MSADDPATGAPLCFDVEFGRDGRFHAMAARRAPGEERVWEREAGHTFDRAHDELVAWLRPDDVLVGHNAVRFDLPEIARRRPDSPLRARPVVDTLVLSVLAFPRRPYHALVKDDRLVRDAVPNPLSDARASGRLLDDAIAALRALPPAEADVLRALIRRLEVPEPERAGWRWLFARLGWGWDPPPPLDLARAWAGRACVHASVVTDPPVGMPLLMVAAWLRAAAHQDGSVLPAWVRRTWPRTAGIARALRGAPCGEPGCGWCAEASRPERWLRATFGFDGFRARPEAPGGGSLQRELVAAGLRGAPTFGILPTGGGKSLCFQVPAEARYRLLGQLTVVISPLRSLMKDQVDQLQDRIPHARAIYGGLPAVARPQVFDEVRTGACGLLYLSPEQLRNAGVVKLLSQRELGAVVFDEAHCLSQWGHDFRTDYPYVLRAIRAMVDDQGLPMPPVFLFTATAPHDAVAQIVAHVREVAGQEVRVLDGGSARDNLAYEVRRVPEHGRLDAMVELIGDHLGDGAAIVFCGSRRGAEDTARDLTARGLPAVAYHAGLDGDARRALQDAFLDGTHRIITATNAFGMGVDKPDVRLVVHRDMPSSLAAYLQEAGRAGRDRKPARAVLLWSPGDAEARFALGALSDLSEDDLRAVWRAIRQLPAIRGRGGSERRVVTPRELLFQEALAGRFNPRDEREETRVKAGVNWLERAGVLERRENRTMVFSGRPKLPDLERAHARVDALGLAPGAAARWKGILRRLYDRGDDGLSADDLAVGVGELREGDPLQGGERVLSALHQMVEAGLVTAGQTLVAVLRRGVRDDSRSRLARWTRAEQALVDHLAAHGLGDGTVHLAAVAEKLSTEDARCGPRQAARLLRSWSYAARGQDETLAVRVHSRSATTARLDLDASLDAFRGWLRRRAAVARVVLDLLVDRADGAGIQVPVTALLETLVDAVRRDLALADIPRPVEATRAALLWMHDLRVLHLQNGLAVFHSAMCIDRSPGAPGFGGQTAQHVARELAEHQAHRVLEVHVMQAWARAMLDDPARAERLRADWFALPVAAFKARWFPGRDDEVRRPTTPESHDRIVGALDPDQRRIVTADVRRNHLVLAGPGSGKTRVLVHRVAWLLRCQRVRGREILVVCYTRANAVELRRRLRELVGDDARGVAVRTLHGVAVRMVGLDRLRDGSMDLDGCLWAAAALLRGERLDEDEAVRQRDDLLAGRSWLFVDEYQDLDDAKYALLSAMAGRAMGASHRRLKVFAVGDDDQAIYGFDGARVDFIHQFEDDYRARRAVLRRCYRCPAAVLELGQALVAPLPGRLKAGETLRVDPARRREPPMGAWAAEDPVLQGRIPWVRAGSVREACAALMDEVCRLVDRGVPPDRIGVLARSRPGGLFPLRVAAEKRGVPFRWTLSSALPLARIREVAEVLEWLDGADDLVPRAAVEQRVADLPRGPWREALCGWLDSVRPSTRHAAEWRRELWLWARAGRAAEAVGEGVHLGTMHGAKGLEFDHVLLLDDGAMPDTGEERRLLYVALTRARRSVQLHSTWDPSPAFRALGHPALELREIPPLAADLPPEHAYGVVCLADQWLDFLGRRPLGDPGHRAWERARAGDPCRVRIDGAYAYIVDRDGVPLAALSEEGRRAWLPRVACGLRLKLLAAVRERADTRQAPYHGRLAVDRWWAGVWEARWRDGAIRSS